MAITAWAANLEQLDLLLENASAGPCDRDHPDGLLSSSIGTARTLTVAAAF
jgi:hypothetical protein